MAKFNSEWTVGSHGPLEQLDRGLLTVAGEIVMPLGRFPRRMTVVALGGGRTAIWSAISLRDPEMKQIEALGTPSFIIVPGMGHRLDALPWSKRYPNAKVICPPGAREAVAQAVRVDATTDIMGDSEVTFTTVPGVDEKEGVLFVRRDGGTTLIVNDILANVQHPQGIGAHIMARLFGFGVDRPRMPWVGKRMFVKDQAATAAALREWANDPSLKRIVVSHGDVMDQNPRAVLERVAADLSS